MAFNASVGGGIIRVIPTTDTAGLAVGSDIIFGTPNVVLNRQNSTGSMNYSAISGVFTLVQFRLYRLTFQLRFINFSNTTTGFLVPQWTDNVGTALIGNDGAADYEPSTSTNANQNVASIGQVYYRTTSNVLAKIKIVDGSGTATLEGSTDRGNFAMVECLE